MGKSIYRVTHLLNTERMVRDFDAELWRYHWVKKGGIELLRLEELPDPRKESVSYTEFSTPVSIDFIPEY